MLAPCSWTARDRLLEAEFPDAETDRMLGPCFNPNRPEDLEEAARYLA